MQVTAADYTNDDVIGTVGVAGVWWALVAQDRPAGSVEAAEGPALAAADALAVALTALGEAPDVPCDGLAPADLCALRAVQLHDVLAHRPRPWAAGSQRDHLDGALERLVAALRAGARSTTTAGPTPTAQGRVARLAVSPGGLPKAAVPDAQVGARGLVGDRQANRRHHGKPMQALCLWSAEVIEELQAEGHPIEPGSCGENVLLSGIPWRDLRPGMRLHLGPEVVAEVSAPATPCTKIADSFLDRRFDRIDHARHPWVGRLYAWVEQPGAVRLGDVVRVS